MQTSTTITLGGEFRPPTMSICFSIQDITRTGVRIDKCQTTVCQDNATLAFQDIFDTYQVRNAADDTFRLVQKPSTEFMKFARDRYFKENQKCFRVGRFTHGKSLNALKIRRYSDSLKRVVLSFNYTSSFASMRKRGRITLHNDLDIGRLSNVHVFLWPTGRVRIYHSATITDLLPQPYATSCYDYTADGFASRDVCIDRCAQKEFLRRYRYIEVTISRFVEEDGNVPVRDIPGRQYSNVFRLCEKRCALNSCHSEIYETRNIIIFNDNRPWQFSLPDISSVTQAVYEAKFKFFALAIYLLGIFGLWFGLDALTFPSLLKSLFSRSNNI